MSQKTIQISVSVAIAIVVIGYFFIFGNPFNIQQAIPSSASNTMQGDSTQLIIQDEIVGQGSAARTGDTVTVNYTGKLQDGTVFDTSVGRAPFTFVLGSGDVISGWDTGLLGMKVGGKRVLIIPASMGYGQQGNGPIPGGATLVFEIELVKIGTP